VSVRQQLRPAPLRGERIRELVRRALSRLAAAEADVRVLVVGDDDMARWNREFLERAGTTNVIAFPDEAPGEARADRIAGDILVSAPTCLAQTRGWPGSADERVFYFILHGMLHLAGYDHESGPAGARKMRRREAELYGAVLGAAAPGRNRSGKRGPGSGRT
jgi:rRNA maturation RNase YbeY